MQLRADVRAIWKLGLFADIRVATEVVSSGGVTVTFEVEKAACDPQGAGCRNHELGLDKINDVLELRTGAVADMVAIRRDRDQLAELYIQHGFYLATVELELVPVGETEVDVRFTVDEHAKIRVRDVEFIGNHELSDDELRATITTRRPDALAFLNHSGIYRRDALERDLAVLSARYLDAGFATVKIGAPLLRLSRDKKFMHVTITIDEGPRFTFGAIDIRGDLLDSL
jgi:outer membrane protein insertion porin family